MRITALLAHPDDAMRFDTTINMYWKRANNQQQLSVKSARCRKLIANGKLRRSFKYLSAFIDRELPSSTYNGNICWQVAIKSVSAENEPKSRYSDW